METLFAFAIVLLIVGLAGGYVYRAKKNGVKCIGCPAGGSCGGHGGAEGHVGCGGGCAGCGGSCSCSHEQ